MTKPLFVWRCIDTLIISRLKIKKKFNGLNQLVRYLSLKALVIDIYTRPFLHDFFTNLCEDFNTSFANEGHIMYAFIQNAPRKTVTLRLPSNNQKKCLKYCLGLHYI